MARKPDLQDVALDEDPTASWYASADLTSCSDWDDQDPELYRMMAAPRPAGSASASGGLADQTEVEVEVEVEDTQSLMDAFDEDDSGGYQIGSDQDLPEDFDELETVLPLEELPEDAVSAVEEAGHDSAMYDAAEYDAAEYDAAEDDTIEELDDASIRALIEEWRDDTEDEPSWIGRTVMQLGSAPQWMAELGSVGPRPERTPRQPSAVLVPAYALQCGVVEGEGATSSLGGRSAPTRIARRLWQRDLERIGL